MSNIFSLQKVHFQQKQLATLAKEPNFQGIPNFFDIRGSLRSQKNLIYKVIKNFFDIRGSLRSQKNLIFKVIQTFFDIRGSLRSQKNLIFS